MFVYSMVIADIEKANKIASGDRTFDFTSADPNMKVGNFIHYSYLDKSKDERHPVDENIYMVTCMEKIGDMSVFAIKPVMTWVSYIACLIQEAKIDNKHCYVVMYGGQVYDDCTVHYYKGRDVTFYDRHDNPIHKDMNDIATVTIL